MTFISMGIPNFRGKARQTKSMETRKMCDNVGLMNCNLLSSEQVFYTAKLEQGKRA